MCNVPKTFTAGQYISLDRPPMTTSTADRMMTESYSKLMPPKTRRFKIIEVSPTPIRIEEDGVWATVSIDQATLSPSAKYALRRLLYTPNKPVDGRDDNVDETGGQNSADVVVNAQ